MLASASGHSTPSAPAVTAAAAPTTAAPARAGIQTGDDATAAVAAVAVATVAAVAAVNVAVAPAIPVSPNPGPDTPTPRQNVKGSMAVKDLWIITSIMQGHENLWFFKVRSP